VSLFFCAAADAITAAAALDAVGAEGGRLLLVLTERCGVAVGVESAPSEGGNVLDAMPRPREVPDTLRAGAGLLFTGTLLARCAAVAAAEE
jgi:hypothetical protein